MGHGALRLALVTWCPWTGPHYKQTLCLSPHYDIAMEHGAVRLALGLAPIMIIEWGCDPHYYNETFAFEHSYNVIMGHGP